MSYLLSGVSAASDDGDSADLEELHLVRRVRSECAGLEDFVVVNRDREFGVKFGVCGLATWGKRATGAWSHDALRDFVCGLVRASNLDPLSRHEKVKKLRPKVLLVLGQETPCLRFTLPYNTARDISSLP